MKGLLPGLCYSDKQIRQYPSGGERTTYAEVDASGQTFTYRQTAVIKGYDTYCQLQSENYIDELGDTSLLEKRYRSTIYERDQSFIDKWLLQLPSSVYTESQVVDDMNNTVVNETNYDYYDTGLVHHKYVEPEDPSGTGYIVEYKYSPRGTVASLTKTGATTSVTQETDTTPDSNDDLPQVVTNPLGQMTSYGYHFGYGQVATAMDGNGLYSRNYIDLFGRAAGTGDSNGPITEISYEPISNGETAFLGDRAVRAVYKTKTVNRNQSTLLSFYDSFNRVIGTTSTDGDGKTLHTTNYYDSLGRKVVRSHRPFADGKTEYDEKLEHDNLGRAIYYNTYTDATNVGTNHIASFKFLYGHPDEMASLMPGSAMWGGVTATQTNYPNKSIEKRLLDEHQRVLGLVDRGGMLTTYTYAATGGVTTFTDQAGQVISTSYDRSGRVIFNSDPIRGTASTFYDDLGTFAETITSAGYSVATYSDALGRPTQETSSSEGTTTWSYDNEPGAIGKLTNVTGPPTAATGLGHSVHYTYGQATDTVGNRGQIRSTTYTIANQTFAIDNDYDTLGRLSTVHYPALSNQVRYSVTNTYSPGDRLQKVVEADGGQGRTLWEVTAFDSQGRNQNVQSLGVMNTGYQYGTVDGLLSGMTTVEGNNQEASVSYAYDYDHNITSIGWMNNGSYTSDSRIYAHDPGGRLTDEYAAGSASDGTLQKGTPLNHIDYSSNGNISNKTNVGAYSYNQSGNPYAVTTAGNNYTFGYDSRGRLISRTTDYASDGTETINWTDFDAPSSITGSDGTQTNYEYDGLKHRVLETVLKNYIETQRKWRVGDIYQRLDSNGQSLHSMRVKAGDAIIAEVQVTDDWHGNVSAANVNSIVSDRLGSTTIVRDPSGNYSTMTYDAFGKAATKSSLASGIGFAGYDQDNDRALLWMTNRPYDPTIGRVLTADPIVAGSMGQDGANRYSYVYNHPTALIDPSGFDGEDICAYDTTSPQCISQNCEANPFSYECTQGCDENPSASGCPSYTQYNNTNNNGPNPNFSIADQDSTPYACSLSYTQNDYWGNAGNDPGSLCNSYNSALGNSGVKTTEFTGNIPTLPGYNATAAQYGSYTATGLGVPDTALQLPKLLDSGVEVPGEGVTGAAARGGFVIQLGVSSYNQYWATQAYQQGLISGTTFAENTTKNVLDVTVCGIGTFCGLPGAAFAGTYFVADQMGLVDPAVAATVGAVSGVTTNLAVMDSGLRQAAVEDDRFWRSFADQ